MMQAVTCCRDEAVSHHLSIAAAFWIIWIVSTEECSSLMQNLTQIHCSTRSVIFSVMATQYTCSLNGVYHPHWLVQWSHPCSYMHIPVHSPWLPGSIHVTQTILLILTMAGLSHDRPHILCGEWYLMNICVHARVHTGSSRSNACSSVVGRVRDYLTEDGQQFEHLT